MKINLYNLSINQAFTIKGIAIILIVLHNFIHYACDLKENEIFFDPNVLPHIVNVICNDPSAIFNGILSYLGHFGVQLFILLSGFGLTKKYLSVEKIIYKEYIIPRLVKIY